MVSLNETSNWILRNIGVSSGQELFNQILPIFFAILFGICIIIITRKIFFSNKMKGGKSKMAGKKKVKKVEISDDETGGGYLSELDDIENEHSDQDDSQEPEENDEVLEKLLDIEKKLEKHENAITTNQKYIKKIWDEVKQLKEHFDILIQK